jgi:16S rRNA C1402 (ribose-2'-O) methylase RsmI
MNKLIEEMKAKLDPNTKIFVGRELTKKFEQYYLTSVGDLELNQLESKGEFVIVIDSSNSSVLKNRDD